MKELYDQISERLNRINFDLIWPGFHRYEFAIYTSEKVQFDKKEIPWDERFIGNTSIDYDGSYIAIWDVEHDFMNNDSKDIDILASNIVHEMFHAFQQEKGEKRYPKDLVALKYPDSIENYNLKYEENKLLADAFRQQDLIKKRALLNYFCGIRQKRESLIGTMCECEYLVETLEGMAEYAGISALEMLSQSKYKSRINTYLGILCEFTANQLNIRRISYYSGVILLLTARDAGINIIHPISEENKTVFRIISKFLSPEFYEILHYDNRIKTAVEETRGLYKKEIELFIREDRIKQNGDFYIRGYDPMNMIRLDNYILCKTFARLMDEDTKETITFMGETLLEMYPESVDRVHCYYR